MVHQPRTARATFGLAATVLLTAVATLFPVPAAADPDPTSVHVHRIRYGSIVTDPQRLDVTVSIRDNESNRVEGALVTGEWFIEGVSQGEVIDVTNSGGHAQWYWHAPINAVFEFCVNNISAVGLVYELAENNETCEQIEWTNQTDPATVHVEDIRILVKETANKATALVQVQNDIEANVEAAIVTGEWTVNTVGQGEATGETNVRGKARVHLLNPPGGAALKFCVTDVNKAGLTYDPSDNTETCETTTWPGESTLHFTDVRIVLRTDKDRAIGKATVEDAQGNRVEGVTVTGEWTVNGLPLGDSNSTTNANGRSSSIRFSPPAGAALEFCASNITGTGFIYAPGDNTTALCATDTWP